MSTQQMLASILANAVACGAVLAGSAQVGSVALAVSSLHWLLNVLIQTQDINGRSDGKPLAAPQQRLLGSLDLLVVAGCAAYIMAVFQFAHDVVHLEFGSAPLVVLWSLPGVAATALFINARKGGETEDHERINDSLCALWCSAIPSLAALLTLVTRWNQIDWVATVILLGMWVWRVGWFLKLLLR